MENVDVGIMESLQREAATPTKPRRPKKAFDWFVKLYKLQIRKSYSQAHQDASTLNKSAKDNWKELGELQRAPFKELQVNDLHRFRVERENYKLKLNKVFGDEYGYTDNRQPNAYVYFSNEKRLEVQLQNPTLQAKDVMKVLAGMWNTMGPDMRQKYKDKCVMAVAEANNASASFLPSQFREGGANLTNLSLTSSLLVENSVNSASSESGSDPPLGMLLRDQTGSTPTSGISYSYIS